MIDATGEADLRRRAERRVAMRLGFYVHATVFAVVNLGLLAINRVVSPEVSWSVWPLFGWGVGLAAHGFAVFANLSRWRERAVAAEVERLRRG
jgi:hypothetical protein